MTTFTLEKKEDSIGQTVDTLVCHVEGKPDEDWCTVPELNQLFDVCVKRWGGNWDLEKVKLAILECEFD